MSVKTLLSQISDERLRNRLEADYLSIATRLLPDDDIGELVAALESIKAAAA